jgi:hypothetical protein
MSVNNMGLLTIEAWDTEKSEKLKVTADYKLSNLS